MPAGRANNLGVTTQQLYRWVEYGLHCQSVQVKRLGLIYQIESTLSFDCIRYRNRICLQPIFKNFYVICFELACIAADISILRDLSLGQADINKVGDLVTQHTAALKHAFCCTYILRSSFSSRVIAFQSAGGKRCRYSLRLYVDQL